MNKLRNFNLNILQHKAVQFVARARFAFVWSMLLGHAMCSSSAVISSLNKSEDWDLYSAGNPISLIKVGALILLLLDIVIWASCSLLNVFCMLSGRISFGTI